MIFGHIFYIRAYQSCNKRIYEYVDEGIQDDIKRLLLSMVQDRLLQNWRFCFSLQKLSWVCNVACQCRSCSSIWWRQIDLSFFVPHPSREVPIGRGDADLHNVNHVCFYYYSDHSRARVTDQHVAIQIEKLAWGSFNRA